MLRYSLETNHKYAIKYADFNGVGLISVQCIVLELFMKMFTFGVYSMGWFCSTKAGRYPVVTFICKKRLVISDFKLYNYHPSLHSLR